MTTDPLFRMTIQDVFSIRGRGTVAIGTVESGSIRLYDVVCYRDKGILKQAVVTGIEAFRKQLSQAEAGQTVGLLLRAVERGQIQVGDVLSGSEVDFEGKP